MSSRIKTRRKQLGLSREALAEKVSVSSTYIQKIERGHVPSDEVIVRLAGIIGEDPITFLLECRAEAASESVACIYRRVLEKMGRPGSSPAGGVVREESRPPDRRDEAVRRILVSVDQLTPTEALALAEKIERYLRHIRETPLD